MSPCLKKLSSVFFLAQEKKYRLRWKFASIMVQLFHWDLVKLLPNITWKHISLHTVLRSSWDNSMTCSEGTHISNSSSSWMQCDSLWFVFFLFANTK